MPCWRPTPPDHSKKGSHPESPYENSGKHNKFRGSPVHLSLELETKYNSLSIFPGIYSSTLSSRKGAAGNLLSSTPSFPNGALLQTYRK
jgi:hypothetical protein